MIRSIRVVSKPRQRTLPFARAASALLFTVATIGVASAQHAAVRTVLAQVAGPESSTKPPVNTSMPSVRLPRAKQAVLDNGLRLLVLEDSSALPAFTAQLVFIDGGGLYEPAERRGLASFTAEMLREGTRTHSGAQISRELETLGATLETQAPLDSPTATISVAGLTPNLERILALLADLTRNPTFPEPARARYASSIGRELELKRAQPEFLAHEQFLRAIYRDHPAALAAPSIGAIQATTREDLERFHAIHYRPNGTLLVVTGAVTLDEILRNVRNLLGDWPSRETPQVPLPPTPKPPSRSIHLVDRPGSVQTVIQLGVFGIVRTDADYFPLLVMNEIVGAGPTSRLVENLRERHGYTYGAYSKLNATQIPGVWQVTTPVRTEVTAEAVKEILAELRRICEEPVPPEELLSAQRALMGKYIFSLEQPQRLLDNVVTQALYGLPAEYWDTYPQQVAAVSPADIARVAKKIIDLDHLQIAAVGDAATIRAALAQFGPVQEPAAKAQDESSTAKPVER